MSRMRASVDGGEGAELSEVRGSELLALRRKILTR
jgi:hypothetical protein